MRLEVKVQELCLATESVQSSQQRSFFETSKNLASHQETLDQLFLQLSRLQEGHQHTHRALQELENTVITHRVSTQTADRYTAKNEKQLEASSDDRRMGYGSQQVPVDTLSVKVRQLRGLSCSICSCNCHSRQQATTPPLFDRVIGSLFVGYTNVPVLAPRCNNSACNRNSNTLVTATYIFPRWFWHRILSIMIFYTQRGGLEFNLRIYQVYTGYGAIFQYAASGDVAGMKALFRSGEVSPFAIDIVSQACPLYVSRSISFLCSIS